MHPSAMKNGEYFFQRYMRYVKSDTALKVVDIGAQNVNGSLREVCPPGCEYIGVDFVAANGVDVILDDPYTLPFADNSIDVVVSSSCFEHSEMFWVLFLEVLRVLKPHGLFYLNAPSNGAFHRYPVDCWRFYPDSGKALISWAKRNNYNSLLLESFVSYQKVECWSDFVAVFVKDAAAQLHYPERMFSGRTDIENVHVANHDKIINFSEKTEDLRNISAMQKQLAQVRNVLDKREQ
ncbi:methyltransferase type 11 [Rheinheimera sp. KL1]|uniref:class I SAM-dependent methyltransferase n=1 Tax=Rheinheimera sp. KL1 TaxID=1635005 RepID=UPI0006A9F8CC|nr:class I SAM-dependent methyltransferase [Rheinheimera sp. KL1]KOO58222.1 methyltransferase type 11 [Rheinheimera sp. KL1]